LSDAKKAMADPHAVSKPSYNLETSLKLQFDNSGHAQAVEAHNILWSVSLVPRANEITWAASTAVTTAGAAQQFEFS
jgi:hypothetical protein